MADQRMKYGKEISKRAGEGRRFPLRSQAGGSCLARKDSEGVSMILEYLLTFTIALLLFTVMLTMFNGLFIDGPTKIVSGVQYSDIGNDVAAKMIDTYLIAPVDGSVKTSFDIPLTVAGGEYTVQVDKINSNDVEIQVYSLKTGTSRRITINGIYSTITLNGITNSLSDTHWIEYKSK